MKKFKIIFIVIFLTFHTLYGLELNDSSKMNLKEPTKTNEIENSGLGMSFGIHTIHKANLKFVFGNVPMVQLNMFGENDKRITVLQLGYGVKNSINDKIYIEYKGTYTNNFPDFTFYKNLVVSCFNIDGEFLYKIIDHGSFRFVAGPGMNYTGLKIKGDEMKGLAGGLLYGDELREGDNVGGVGLSLATGIYVFLNKLFLQFHFKYETPGLWYYKYYDTISLKSESEMGFSDCSGFQISFGLGLQTF